MMDLRFLLDLDQLCNPQNDSHKKELCLPLDDLAAWTPMLEVYIAS